MNESREQQQALHDVIEASLDEGDVLTGWIIIFETTRFDDQKASAGHFYGPREMTTWRALGLMEWARRFGLTPDEEE